MLTISTCIIVIKQASRSTYFIPRSPLSVTFTALPLTLHRYLTSSSSSSSCPFELLGIARDCSYVEVKRQFLRLAMKSHPDMVVIPAEKENAEIRFVEIRAAFERIKPLQDGRAEAIAAIDDESYSTSAGNSVRDGFDDWFYSETGSEALTQAYLDRKSKLEIRKFLKDNPTPGGIDRGGMWQLARMVAEYSKDDSKHTEMHKIESGKLTTRRRKKR